ncbi:MAG TPA: ATP-binding protein [Rhodothermales bacterium]|nr:ATP-binding protein [Rhodothermales bacterium]
MQAKNPFEFGRELSGAELVDRGEELATVVRTMGESGRLFLIGPRRFGKTSILRVAAERAEAEGTVVFRYDAEAYPTLRLLAESVVAEAASRLTGTVERAGKKLREFFGALRPQVSFNPLDNTFSASITTDTPAPDTTLLTAVLDGLDRMAGDAGRRVALVIDEFQQVIEQDGSSGGLAIERQLRAAVQRHEHLAYVFAGSKTGMLAEMTGDPSRPFYRLGARLFIGPIPRGDFSRFLRSGFEGTGFEVDEEAVTEILDLAEDVPYNVQRLAHECWNDLRSGGGTSDSTGAGLGAADVRAVLERVVRRDDPFYTQTWNRLTSTQQKALLALVRSSGEGLFAKDTLRTYGVASSTMRTALEALVRVGIARQEETLGSVRLRLEDPFFASWMKLFVAGP